MNEVAMEDRVIVCTQHLETMGRALAAYQHDHGELPPHLSDLYPEHIADPGVFHCPADASPGSPGVAWAGADPRFPSSYVYEMSTDEAPFPSSWLGPPSQGEKATWRDNKMRERTSYGDRVPVIRCFHHGGFRLNLTLTGEVYRDKGRWEDEPGTITAALACMGDDLEAGPERFTRHWSLSAVEQYASRWIDSALPPALRFRLGTTAEQLAAAADALPPPSRIDALFLVARFERGSGNRSEALAACQKVLRHSPGHPSATFLLADIRYAAGRRRGAPPVDAYLKAEMARLHIPGLSVAVVRDGKVIRANGYGLANVELSVPATPDTVYAIYSVTKQFTATAVMILVEEGKVSLEGKITDYLADLPAAWSEVTVRHLLNHTSGVKSYSGLPDFPKTARQDVTQQEIIERVAGLPLEFQPGEKFVYNNTGYFLLGMLIETVSGQSYGKFLTTRIFQPLEMIATRVNDWSAIIKNRASGYTWKENILRNCDYYSPTQPYAAGALVSTVIDLAKWDAALYTEKLLRRSSLEQMWTPTKLKDGTVADYGFGWRIGSYRGYKVVQHGGGYLGFLATIHRFVDDRLAVILLTNLDSGDPEGMANRVADFHLPAPKPVEDRDPQTTQRLKDILTRFVEGKPEPTRLTSVRDAPPALEAEQTSAFYQSLGPLKSFRLIERINEEKQRTYRYRAVFGDTKWIQTFVLIDEGKIAALSVEPE